MNKRIKKKKVKYTVNNIQKLSLNSDEFLVFRFNTKDFRLDEIDKFSKIISARVSNKIVFVPIEFEMIKVCNKKEG